MKIKVPINFPSYFMMGYSTFQMQSSFDEYLKSDEFKEQVNHRIYVSFGPRFDVIREAHLVCTNSDIIGSVTNIFYDENDILMCEIDISNFCLIESERIQQRTEDKHTGIVEKALSRAKLEMIKIFKEDCVVTPELIVDLKEERVIRILKFIISGFVNGRMCETSPEFWSIIHSNVDKNDYPHFKRMLIHKKKDEDSV